MAEVFNKKKSLGQNFLTSDKIPIRIAEACGADKTCGVIEIGPGMGILTKQLALRVAKVVAIEIDDELIPILAERFADADNVKVINEDVLKCDISAIIKEEFSGLDVAVCANLPYYITTPIIMALLEGNYGFKSITIMIQKEVAERLCAKAGSPTYGAVTAAVNYYASVKKQFVVGAANFSPKPKVDSAVITITPYEDKPVKPQNEGLFFKVLKAAFATRRKTLVNSLSTAFSTISKGDIQRIVSACHSPTVRGEELSVAELAKISDEINKLIYTTEERQ
ncbi:MAG: 16S rRNA (adenine(1518)-N(6)/adenine(1519)-N(6))-dimethyltransferase RsmA [Clostridia bacterium]|nr:16S rRNA (adenine(1518)-N(6)/adenine(1519)-N(6))-dimethyltransferase RsmA [Clostridia bacterium]